MNTPCVAYLLAVALIAPVTAAPAQQPRAKATAAKSPTEAPHWVGSISRSYLYDRMNQGELYSVEFLNYRIGFAVGGHSDSTMIFRTVDGGETWERVGMYDGQQHVPRFNKIRFADANNGWMAGDEHVLRTTDGGESWSPAPVSDPSGGNSLRAISLLVLGPNALMIGTRNSTVYTTTDGGATWVSSRIADGFEDIVGLSFAGPNRFFAVTSTPHGKGTIHSSVDGGRTWQLQESVNAQMYAIDFRDQRGVATGTGLALVTEDGGASWRRVVASGERESVRFIDAQTVISTGNSPHVALSRDGGKSWRATGSPITGSSGHLVDVAAPDIGWWFVAGGYGANALYHYVDPGYTAPITSGRVPLPVNVRLPGGRTLPRGLYDVTLGHRGDEHVVVLRRDGDVPAGTEVPADLKAAADRAETQKPLACASPCAATLPVEVTYEKVETAAGKDPKSFFNIRLEPTPNGVAIVVETAVTPPRDLHLALAALGAPQTADGEVRNVGAQAAKKGGGLFDRARKAASGDVRGAVAGAVNPQETAARLKAAKSAPPALYRITLRHSLELFGGPQTASAEATGRD